MAERPPPGPTIINALFLALILITAGLFLIGLVWVALPIFAVMLVLATLSLVLGFYLTPEDAVGIVYWHLRGRDYFHRFVPPRTFTWIVPFVQRVKEVPINTRSTEISLVDVLTRDRQPVTVRALFVYRVRADHTDERYRHELASFTDERWTFIVRKMGTQALQQAVRSYAFDDLFHPEAYDTLIGRIQTIVTSYVRPRGIEMIAVSIQDLRPGQGIQRSVHQAAAAGYDAQALRERLTALNDALGASSFSSRDLWLVQLLTGLQEQGTLPPLIVSLSEGHDLDTLIRLLQLIQLGQRGGSASSRGNGRARDDGSPRDDASPTSS